MKQVLRCLTSIAIILLCWNCSGQDNESYEEHLEQLAVAERKLKNVDSLFNEMQAYFQLALQNKKNVDASQKVEFQAIGNKLAIQNSKLAQADAKLEYFAALKKSDFIIRDTTVSINNIEQIKSIISILTAIESTLDSINTHIKEIKE